MTSHNLTAQPLALAALHPYPVNPRRGNVAAIAESLRENGQFAPIVVNLGTLTGRPYEVLSGNHTVKAAEALGWKQLDAVLLDLDDRAARRVVLAANRTADLASYDAYELNALLATIDDPTGTGYTAADLAALLTPQPLPEAAAVPPMPSAKAEPVEGRAIVPTAATADVLTALAIDDPAATYSTLPMVVTVRLHTPSAAAALARWLGEQLVDGRSYDVPAPVWGA